MNKKKTTAILSLSFAFAVAFGGSTLPDNTGDVTQKLNYNLDKLESFTTCTDWTNPSDFIFGDEMFLGYDNQYYYYYTPKTLNPNFNTQKQTKSDEDNALKSLNENQTENQNKTTQNTTPRSSTKQSNNTTNNNVNNSTYNQNSSNNNNTNGAINNLNNRTNQNNPNVRGKIDTMQRAPNIDTYKNTTNDYGVDPIKRNNQNTNNNGYNTNQNFNNFENNTNQNYNNNNNGNRTYVAPNGTTATVAANEAIENRSMLSIYENQLSAENNQLKTQCNSLKQNIQSLRANLQSTTYSTTQQKALRAYNRVLGKVAHKLSKCQMELVDASSRLYILASDQENNADMIDAQILEIKSIMSTQVALYECANQALTEIKQFVLGDNIKQQNDTTTNNENSITANDVNNQTNQIENNQTRTTQKSNINQNTTSRNTTNNQNASLDNNGQNQYNPIENNKRSNQSADLQNTNQNQSPYNNESNLTNNNRTVANGTQNSIGQNTNLKISNTMPKLPANQ